MSLTVFDLSGNERIAEWKKFRNSLETSVTPLEDVIDFWSKAPFVNHFLNPLDSSSWPDPWQLILDNRYDDLAISLGIAYTLKLTTRFIDEPIEIHMSMSGEKEKKFPITIKNSVLNWDYKEVSERNLIDFENTILLFRLDKGY